MNAYRADVNGSVVVLLANNLPDAVAQVQDCEGLVSVVYIGPLLKPVAQIVPGGVGCLDPA